MDGRSSSSSNSGTARKRGHQHHIRQEGTRRSNVPADEIIAALRAGDSNPALMPTALGSSADIDQTHRGSDMGTNLAVDNDNNHIYNVNTDDGDDGDVTMLHDDNSRNNNSRRSTARGLASNNNVLADSTNEWLNGMNLSGGDATGTTPTPSSAIVSPSASRTHIAKIATSNLSRISALHEMDKSATKDYDPDQTDSVSSGSSTSNKKSKSKRDSNTKKSSKSSGDPADAAARKEKRKRTKVSQAPPNEERPPLEGAAATDQWNEFDVADIENDPEAAEWSKLRCTSERTEVVAEREYRRQNRRCADYPGLAFGRSIFSSDTMMKLNIIRNELHNIMKTQLKRVRNNDDVSGIYRYRLVSNMIAFRPISFSQMTDRVVFILDTIVEMHGNAIMLLIMG